MTLMDDIQAELQAAAFDADDGPAVTVSIVSPAGVTTSAAAVVEPWMLDRADLAAGGQRTVRSGLIHVSSAVDSGLEDLSGYQVTIGGRTFGVDRVERAGCGWVSLRVAEKARARIAGHRERLD